MKKILLISALAATTLAVSCDVLSETANSVLGGTGGTAPAALTNDEVITGLKEALKVGTNNGAGLASKVDGFWKNDRLRLPFPPDAQKVKDKCLQLGIKKEVDEFELTLNRAAEEACKEAAPIFVNAITSMSIADGFNILNGGDGAATKYLKEKTTEQLKTAFQPKVKAAIDKVQLTKYWEPLANTYNKATALTGGEKVNPDLEKYITGKAIDGLFTLINDEENKIRKDPMARVSDILVKVFGSLDNK
jgi:hypothetical protein